MYKETLTKDLVKFDRVSAAAIEQAGYAPGEDIALCLDPATSEMWQNGSYVAFKSDQSTRTSADMIELWQSWIDRYPIVLIEDALAENDWDGWIKMNDIIGDKIQLVGDDLTVTNTKKLQKAIDQRAINAILIKLNQIGTVTETLDAIKLAQKNSLGVIVSHRSGETEDVTISDLAVGTSAGQIKTGSLARTDRVAKYNQLLRIEEQIKTQSKMFHY